MSGGVDEHGRPISADGWYVWDGTQWAQRQAQPVRHLSPDGRYEWSGHQWVPIAQPAPMPVAPAQQGIDLEAEVRTYPMMSRMLKGSVREIPQHLDPGEPVLALAPITSWEIPRSTSSMLLTGYNSPAGVLMVATDRRLLMAVYSAMGGSISYATSARYEEIDRWLVGKGTVTVHAVGWDRDITFEKPMKGKLEVLRAVVEPRLHVR